MTEIVYRRREPAGEPQGALVLLHGRGADEHDLVPLLDALDPERRLIGITPRGPLSLPPGGAHWYAVHQIGFPDPATFLPTYELVSAWLDELPAVTGVPLRQTVIGGFSQGSVMTYALSLGAGREAPAGIVALSGFMPTVDGLTLELEGRAGFPAAIGHGAADSVIAVEWGRRARDQLSSAGADVVFRESPMGHTIDPRFIHQLEPWIVRLTSTDRTPPA